MIDLVVGIIIAVVLASAGYAVYRSKKSGKKCIGCPEGGCENCENKCR